MLDSAEGGPGTDGRATRWDRHNSQRRREMIEAAMTAIEHEGLDVGVKQIAERAGVIRSVVYRHFKDRADLDEQIRRRIVERLMEELSPTLRPDGTVSESIRRAVDTYLGWIERHSRLHAFLGASYRKSATGSPVVSGTKTAIAKDVSRLFAAGLANLGLATEEADSVAFGLVGFIDAAVNRWLASRERTLTAAELSELISRSAWAILEANVRAMGGEISPDTLVGDLLGG